MDEYYKVQCDKGNDRNVKEIINLECQITFPFCKWHCSAMDSICVVPTKAGSERYFCKFEISL